MAITGLSTNYTGRTKDVFISQGLDPLSPLAQTVTYNFGKVSAFIAGVQKLAQKYAVALVNTGLVTQLQSQRANNIQEATHIFNFANWDVISAFQAYQNANPGLPLDETLLTAQLSNIASATGRLSLTIQLTTAAGSDMVFLLPISLT